jgi:hypothetical protein
MAICAKCGNNLEEGINLCTQCGEKIRISLQNETTSSFDLETQIQNNIPEPQITPIENTSKTKTSLRKKVVIIGSIVVGIVIILGFSYWLYSKESPFGFIKQKKLELDENNNIILSQRKNYDKSSKDRLALTLNDVKNIQKYIRKNFPTFDFEEMGYVTDDYRNELFVNDFNNNPQYAIIYLSRIDKMAGYSQVYSNFFILDVDGDADNLFWYIFSIDEEFSDRSGIEFLSLNISVTRNENSLNLWKLKYSDVNEYYWIINWDSDIPNKEKRTMLDSFLRNIRYTKVFENVDLEWFKDIYTGIDRNQSVRDIVQW